jgi:Asp-tRNA(Asn)/Glu-tRNA(Gln) amidotransferase B subunit
VNIYNKESTKSSVLNQNKDKIVDAVIVLDQDEYPTCFYLDELFDEFKNELKNVYSTEILNKSSYFELKPMKNCIKASKEWMIDTKAYLMKRIFSHGNWNAQANNQMQIGCAC